MDDKHQLQAHKQLLAEAQQANTTLLSLLYQQQEEIEALKAEAAKPDVETAPAKAE